MTFNIEQILASPEGKKLGGRFTVPLKEKITIQVKTGRTEAQVEAQVDMKITGV